MDQQSINNNSYFISANTTPVLLEDMSNQHIIPVFTKDNTALISQSQFIKTVEGILMGLELKDIQGPFISCSHPIKGRIPSAKHKSKSELLPHEETIYYERMMFLFKIDSITKSINGQTLSLVVGGIKSYHLDNLNKTSGSPQNFTIFVGYQVKVCSNLCVWSDELCMKLKVSSLDTLGYEIDRLLNNNIYTNTIDDLSDLHRYELTEQQFATLIGKCRMYNHLLVEEKKQLPTMLLGDQQCNHLSQGYYKNSTFSNSNGCINLWSLYNLLTEAVKSSYIDKYLERLVNCTQFTLSLRDSLKSGSLNWFIS